MVEVIRGPYTGQTVKIEHMEGQIQDEDGRLVDEVGYGVQLESGKWATVAWDAVEGYPTPETAWWLRPAEAVRNRFGRMGAPMTAPLEEA